MGSLVLTADVRLEAKRAIRARGTRLKYVVEIGRRFGTRVITADLGSRGPHPWAEVTCDCGYVSRAAVFELVNKGLGCPRLCTTEMLAPAREERRAQDRRTVQAARRADMLSRRAERRTRFAKMHKTMTMKEIGAIEGLSISQVNLVLKGKR